MSGALELPSTSSRYTVPIMPMHSHRILRKHPTYTRLLIMLSLLMAWGPFSQTFAGGGRISAILFAAVLAMAVIEVSPNRRAIVHSVFLAAPDILLQLADALFTVPRWGVVVALVSSGAFLAYVIVLLGRDILTQTSVSSDTIRGAITIYLLLGLFWVTIYSVLALTDPGAITFSDALAREAGSNPREYSSVLQYFSFVTLTTLGYGDISPISPFARFAATTEAIVGQLFIAITVARLVGLQIAGSGDSAENESSAAHRTLTGPE